MVEVLSPGCPFPAKIELCVWEALDPDCPSDYHVHTSHTDGAAGVKEMARAAVSRRMVKILFSEHVRHQSEYFSSFFSEVRALRLSELNAYVGVETKILDFEGSLDCSPQIASFCDSIIGSVHSLPRDGEKKASQWSQLNVENAVQIEFQLALAIVKRSKAHILGHPMGMVIKNFNINPTEELYKLACACSENDKAFEINAHYCLDPSSLIDIVKKSHCKVSLGSDAHATSQIGDAWYRFTSRRLQIS